MLLMTKSSIHLISWIEFCKYRIAVLFLPNFSYRLKTLEFWIKASPLTETIFVNTTTLGMSYGFANPTSSMPSDFTTTSPNLNEFFDSNLRIILQPDFLKIRSSVICLMTDLGAAISKHNQERFGCSVALVKRTLEQSKNPLIWSFMHIKYLEMNIGERRGDLCLICAFVLNIINRLSEVNLVEILGVLTVERVFVVGLERDCRWLDGGGMVDLVHVEHLVSQVFCALLTTFDASNNVFLDGVKRRGTLVIPQDLVWWSTSPAETFLPTAWIPTSVVSTLGFRWLITWHGPIEIIRLVSTILGLRNRGSASLVRPSAVPPSTRNS